MLKRRPRRRFWPPPSGRPLEVLHAQARAAEAGVHALLLAAEQRVPRFQPLLPAASADGVRTSE